MDVPQPLMYGDWKNWAEALTVALQDFQVASGAVASDPSGDYYTKAEVDSLLALKAATVHTHDDRYYTETEINAMFAGVPASFVHTQGSAATTWTVNHNLGFHPAVELRTSGGVEFEAEVTHVNVNQLVVNLSTATAGTARCT